MLRPTQLESVVAVTSNLPCNADMLQAQPIKATVSGSCIRHKLRMPGYCRTNHESAFEAEGRQLRFLANVDPVDVARALNGLKPETTLAVVVSKTFTTAETMLNARTVR